MLTIFSKIAQWGIWSLLGKAFNTPAFRQFALVAGCVAGIYGTLSQCSQKRTAQEAQAQCKASSDTLININRSLVADRDKAYHYADSLTTLDHNQNETDRKRAQATAYPALRTRNDSLLRATGRHN